MLFRLVLVRGAGWFRTPRLHPGGCWSSWPISTSLLKLLLDKTNTHVRGAGGSCVGLEPTESSTTPSPSCPSVLKIGTTRYFFVSPLHPWGFTDSPKAQALPVTDHHAVFRVLELLQFHSRPDGISPRSMSRVETSNQPCEEQGELGAKAK